MAQRLLPISRIKRAQKESLLFREIAALFQQTVQEDPNLAGCFVSRVMLSQDKGHCTVYIYTAAGEAAYLKLLDRLKAYKPSLRKAIAHKIPGRYTPDFVFRFDDKFEKVQELEALLERVKLEQQ